MIKNWLTLYINLSGYVLSAEYIKFFIKKGVCQCSRCLKMDSIAKLKSLYMLLGGNVN